MYVLHISTYIIHIMGLSQQGSSVTKKKNTAGKGWCRLMPVDAWRPKAHVDATAGSEDPPLLGLHAWSSGHGTHQCDVVAAGAGHVQRRREGHVHLLTHAKPGDICWVSLWWFHFFLLEGYYKKQTWWYMVCKLVWLMQCGWFHVRAYIYISIYYIYISIYIYKNIYIRIYI